MKNISNARTSKLNYFSESLHFYGLILKVSAGSTKWILRNPSFRVPKSLVLLAIRLVEIRTPKLLPFQFSWTNFQENGFPGLLEGWRTRVIHAAASMAPREAAAVHFPTKSRSFPFSGFQVFRRMRNPGWIGISPRNQIGFR
jgi:hypothetical protein